MNDTVLVLSLASAVAAGTPILLAALGEVVAERSGVMNLGVEGMMLVGDTSLLERPNGVDVGTLFPEAMADLPLLGPLLFGHDPVVYVAVVMVAVVARLLYRSPMGLSLRAVGEDPAAADAAGLDVVKIRYLSTPFGGFCAGMGGAYLIVAVLGTWQKGATAGAGWIAVALVIVAGWRPWLALIGALAFGVLRGLSFTLQIAKVDIPSDFLAMIPFVAAYLIVVAVSASPSRSRKVAAPAALAVPYVREQR